MIYYIDRTDYTGYHTETATADDLHRIYTEEIDRQKYPDFSGWLSDMMESALITVDSCAGCKYRGTACENQCDGIF